MVVGYDDLAASYISALEDRSLQTDGPFIGPAPGTVVLGDLVVESVSPRTGYVCLRSPAISPVGITRGRSGDRRAPCPR